MRELSATSVNRKVRRILRDSGQPFERWETTSIRGYRRFVAGFVTRPTENGVVITHRGAALHRLDHVRGVLQTHGLAATLEASESDLYPWRLFIPTQTQRGDSNS